MNNITLVGRLTKDIELKTTKSNITYTQISIAIQREFKDETGERPTDFFDMTIWKQQAEYLSNYANKGDVIGITGRIQKRTYEQNGSTQYITEIIPNQVSIVARKDKPEPKQEVKPQPKPEPETKRLANDSELPF